MSNTLIILGAGYTARFVLPLAARQYAHVLATSREPDHQLKHLPLDQRIKFDLTQRETWKNLPSHGDLLWCFPAEPPDLVHIFSTELNAAARRLVVLGSTSAYLPHGLNQSPPSWIDETVPVDTEKPRVEGEEFLRRHCRAIILRVAGIYGPGRNPIDWIKTGRVGSSRKLVNLIHVEDLATICLVALRCGISGDVYNVSDGTPREWKDICRIVQDHMGIVPVVKTTDSSIGKRIAIGKLLALLETGQEGLAHADLYRALDRLHSNQSTI